MKKILIFSHALEIGGAERALIGLLETIDTTKYEVDLFLMRHRGELMTHIPENINLLPENKSYSCLAVSLAEVLKKGKIRVALGRYKGKKAAAKRVKELGFGDNDVELEYSHKYTLKYMPIISNKDYDLAISFLTPHYFVAEKVNAKKKVAWIHTDYSVVEIDTESQIAMWDRYDKIASISDNAAKVFVEKFPRLKEKVITIQNILPDRYIDSLTNEYTVEGEMNDDGCIKLLSIGRFCTAKNFDNIPEICKLIRNHGLNVNWYIVGYGNDEKLIKSKIKESGMEKYVIILGKKGNPYPYIKACDLYVQPSRYEGRCVSVTEAQLMHKPVVITNYATASSQLTDGYDGVIVPMDNSGCADGIVRVLKDKVLLERLVNNTKREDYTNKREVEKIYALLD